MSQVVCIARMTSLRGVAFVTAATGVLDVESIDHDLIAASRAAITEPMLEATCLVIDPSPAVAALLSRFRNLRFLQLLTCSQGDVDVIGLQRAGVQVANVSEPMADTVAEYTMLLIGQTLGPGKSLSGKTVGIVGLGRVGLRVARLSSAAGAHVVFAEVRTPPQDAALNSSLRRATLDQLLTTADVTSLHLPYGPTSKGLIGARELRLMPDAAVLVNTSDPRVIQLDAAMAWLRSRPRASVALGYPCEARDDAHRVNMVDAMTPEAASETASAHRSAAEFAVANVKRVLAGAPARSAVEILDAPAAGDPAFWSSRLYPRRPEITN